MAHVCDGGTGDLAALGSYLDATFEHQLINERIPFHPTCELLARHLAEWFTANIDSAVLASIVVSETPATAAHCDGATLEVTISKTFVSAYGEVTVLLEADDLDEAGFITDFGDLSPFAACLRDPAATERLCGAGPAIVVHLARWFGGSIEPKIRARLRSLRMVSGSTTSSWERGDVA
ncbi:hypothetical protein GCM10011609_77350 [Lentzea pudingi]|uniref:6-carboxy-5,6,7,8-tetrahydropterin synthase n=1 Tax=Lentzea pudingi TaxID=1789439 RepID=A0ABQ2ISV8_9PSEU|nr:hypothetical protein GCM10011609_77350 [Lentzea pudingi]